MLPEESEATYPVVRWQIPPAVGIRFAVVPDVPIVIIGVSIYRFYKPFVLV